MTLIPTIEPWFQQLPGNEIYVQNPEDTTPWCLVPLWHLSWLLDSWIKCHADWLREDFFGKCRSDQSWEHPHEGNRD